jgi:hypothetical protein
MIRALIGSLLCGITIQLSAQADDYFQQHVAYRIEVRLDDREHTLHGNLALDYTNNAPEALPELYFHLWPNAYRSDETAFAEQQLRNGQTRFHWAADRRRGYIDSLDFRVGGTAISSETVDGHPDVVRLTLPQPLAPGATLRLTTPFRVKIPDSFSRLGHLGESYQLTQWYPKPAVYDRDGWHPMPYLDQGEFYSEFGSYDVRITLPENYVVAATGVLQTPAERQELIRRATETRAWLDTVAGLPDRYVAESYPPSASATKTLRYTAERVHDFAWFADKRFRVLYDTLRIAGRTIDSWSFFTETEAALWRRSIDYIERATRFYSEVVGPYPYPQVTAVQSALSAGAGMEYPMITVIGLSGNGRALDEVITHEVGHNWFYGILGSDERAHAWQDEGINSYYEQRYMRRYYAPVTDNSFAGQIDWEEVALRYPARLGFDQAPATPAGALRETNYWLNAYQKPARAFAQLADYLGRPALDSAMQVYFREWAFRHPRPADLRAVLARETGQDPAWLFADILEGSRPADHRIRAVQPTAEGLAVTVVRNGARLPLAIGVRYADRDTFATFWREPVAEREATYLLPVAAPVEEVRLFPGGETLENFRGNDRYRPGALLPRWRWPRPALLLAADTDGTERLILNPWLGYNDYNGLMTGLLFHNRAVLPQRFEYYLAPAYAFGDRSLAGVGELRYRFLPGAEQRINRIDLYAQGRRFGYRQPPEPFGGPLHYHRATFGVAVFSLAGKQQQWWERYWVEADAVFEEELDFTGGGELLGRSYAATEYLSAGYRRHRPDPIRPLTWGYRLEFSDAPASNPLTPGDREWSSYLKLEVSAAGKYVYQPQKAFHYRLFAGYFLTNPFRNANTVPRYGFSLIDHGALDYRYQDYYFGRTSGGGAGQ